MKLWELDILVRELLGLCSLHFTVFQNCGSDDLDGFSSGTVSAGQVHVHLGDGSGEGDISVLLVHVHSVCARRISKYDSEVLDCTGLLLENLRHAKIRPVSSQ